MRRNWRADAAAEIDERGRTGDPYVWTGIPSAVCGAYDDVKLPDVGGNVDWELELGVVIGRRAHRVAAEDALDYVAGYTIVNDITARTLVPRNDIAMMGTDWFRAKNQPTFFPTGPYVVPKRFVPDPAKLRIRLSLNGKLMQDALADDLLFDIPSLIAYASSVAVLLPGRCPHHRFACGQRFALGPLPEGRRRDGGGNLWSRHPAFNGPRAQRAVASLVCGSPGRGRRGRRGRPVTLRQSHFVPPVSYLLAAELGFLRGVEVLPTRTPSSAEQLRALLAGEQDMVVTAIDNLFEWTRAGADLRLVAQVEQTTPLGIHAAR